MDMDYCFMAVDSALDIYDELLETYHYSLWENPDNSPLCNTFFELRQTSDSITQLHSDLKARCFAAWNWVLQDPLAQKHFWGREAQIVNKDYIRVFGTVFSAMPEMDYDTTIETSVNSFKAELLRYLEHQLDI